MMRIRFNLCHVRMRCGWRMNESQSGSALEADLRGGDRPVYPP